LGVYVTWWTETTNKIFAVNIKSLKNVLSFNYGSLIKNFVKNLTLRLVKILVGKRRILRIKECCIFTGQNGQVNAKGAKETSEMNSGSQFSNDSDEFIPYSQIPETEDVADVCDDLRLGINYYFSMRL